MIFTEKLWDDGFLIVCGSMWPGAHEGAPMPEGYPDRWRSGQPTAAKRPGGAGSKSASKEDGIDV